MANNRSRDVDVLVDFPGSNPIRSVMRVALGWHCCCKKRGKLESTTTPWTRQLRQEKINEFESKKLWFCLLGVP